MRIRTKLILVYLGIAILFSMIGYYGVQYTNRVGTLFEGVEADSIPSLISLMDIIAATRQASLKATEYSRRGKLEDKTKATDALTKIEIGLASYKITMQDQQPAKTQNLDGKISHFMQVIKSYLSLGTGPGMQELIIDVDRSHELRSSLIRAVNEAMQYEPAKLELTLQHIKSEARKATIKSVEFALDGNTKNRVKAESALEEIATQLHQYAQHAKSNTRLRQGVIDKGEAYIKFIHQYLQDISTSNISIKDIHEIEKQLQQARRAVIHALYPLIENEKQEFREAANETHASIGSAVNVLVVSITVVVLIALIAGYLVARSITRPLQELNDAAHLIAKGDLSQKLNIKTSDETGELATSFNYMRNELKKHRDSMDKLVQERTIALQESNKELESYSYSIAHDLRAPLRSIIGFSQIILEDTADKLDNINKEHLQRIIKAARHMTELIDDILEISRVSRTELQINPVNLSDLCVEISKTLSSTNPERKAEWRIQPDLIVNGDQRLLYMVLSNLLGNAWKFTQKRSPAVIEFGQINEGIEKIYYIRDNGVGFDMAYVDKLFGLFHRLHRADEYEGTGVGLATVKKIINRHKGWVRAEGAEGKGATIYFSLPA
jgi:signal transduction histidine kinase